MRRIIIAAALAAAAAACLIYQAGAFGETPRTLEDFVAQTAADEITRLGVAARMCVDGLPVACAYLGNDVAAVIR